MPELESIIVAIKIILACVQHDQADQTVTMTAEQISEIDGDDQADYRITIEGRSHEDLTPCVKKMVEQSKL